MCAQPFRTHSRVRIPKSRAFVQYIKVGKECRQARFVTFGAGWVRRTGCRDPWFDHSRLVLGAWFGGLGSGTIGSITVVVLGVVRHLPVLRLRPPQAIPADPSTQLLDFPRAAPRQLHPYQGTVLTPGPKASGIVPGQAPSSGPVPGDAENASPDNGVWSINDQGSTSSACACRASPTSSAKAPGAWAPTTSAAPRWNCGRRRRRMATSVPCAAAAMCPIACLGLGPRMWRLSLTASSQRVTRPAKWWEVGFPISTD